MRTCGFARAALRSAAWNRTGSTMSRPGSWRSPSSRARRGGRGGSVPPCSPSTAALALTGSLAAGASALTSTAQAPTRAVEKTGHVVEQGHRWGKRDGLCNKGERPPTPVGDGPQLLAPPYGFVVESVKVSVLA